MKAILSRSFSVGSGCAVAAILFLLAPLTAQLPSPVPGTVPITQPVDSSPTAPLTGNFFDNTKGNLVRHQLGHIQPIALDPAIGHYLFAPNNAGQRMTVTYLPSNTLVQEIPTGPGITSVVHRPNTAEAWAVDRVNGCVSVIDPINNVIMRTIPVGREPHGIAFLSSGDRAYVTCSAANTVDVIDCTSYGVAASILIPAMGPRGVVVVNDATVWVVPLFSGNNTVTKRTDPTSGLGATQEIVHPLPASEQPLPDRDLFAITVTALATSDFLDAARTVTGIGTILLNLHARPNSDELWIPNTDALNEALKGEANFIDGKVVSNRITVVDTVSASIVRVIDLDTEAAQFSLGAAQPSAIAFTSDGRTAYVANFGSDTVLSIDAANYTATGWYVLDAVTPDLPAGGSTPTPTPARCGPRGLAMAADDKHLYVFNALDCSYSHIDLGTVNVTVPTATALGYDPTPASLKRGLGHLANADISATRTSSCFSCHVDGHVDMLSWNLSAFSDPPGTANPQFEQDDKGPMATQSLRGLFEAGPLHWRGERPDLASFNAAFVGLLKAPAPLTTEQFAELELATDSLVYPANPRQPFVRDHAGAAASGLRSFLRTNAIAGMTCATCHTLPTGTNAEIQPFVATFKPANSGKVAQLRGVGDKLAPAHQVFLSGVTQFRTENGWGLTHSASFASFPEFVSQFPGTVGNNEVAFVSAFLEQFDSGLAPATTFQDTIDPAVHAGTVFDNALSTIKARALAGDCDVAVVGSALNGSAMVPFLLAWDHVLGRWQTPAGWASFDDVQLKFLTYSQGWTVTFLGQPLGTARRMAVDRDGDGLLNDDEAGYPGSVPADITNPDSDGDGFPDGYEAVHWPAMHPRATTATSPDTTIPDFTSTISVVYVTTSTAKLEFSTTEPTRAIVQAGPFVSTPSPRIGGHDVNHSILVRQLPPNVSTALTVEIIDPNGLSRTQVVNITPLGTPDSSHVHSINANSYDPVTQTITVDVKMQSFLTGAPAVAHDVEIFAYCEAQGVPLTFITPSKIDQTDVNGLVSFVLSVPPPVAAATNRKLHFGVRTDTFTTGPAWFYLEAKDVENYRVTPF